MEIRAEPKPRQSPQVGSAWPGSNGAWLGQLHGFRPGPHITSPRTLTFPPCSHALTFPSHPHIPTLPSHPCIPTLPSCPRVPILPSRPCAPTFPSCSHLVLTLVPPPCPRALTFAPRPCIPIPPSLRDAIPSTFHSTLPSSLAGK